MPSGTVAGNTVGWRQAERPVAGQADLRVDNAVRGRVPGNGRRALSACAGHLPLPDIDACPRTEPWRGVTLRITSISQMRTSSCPGTCRYRDCLVGCSCLSVAIDELDRLAGRGRTRRPQRDPCLRGRPVSACRSRLLRATRHRGETHEWWAARPSGSIRRTAGCLRPTVSERRPADPLPAKRRAGGGIVTARSAGDGRKSATPLQPMDEPPHDLAIEPLGRKSVGRSGHRT